MSEVDKGSRFVFLFTLDEVENLNEEGSRLFNPSPVSKVYKKIKILEPVQNIADTVVESEQSEEEAQVVDTLNVRRILIVDDEPFIQEGMKILIKDS